jgi:hypothetical protein
MAVGMFLKISAIKGESRDGAHTRSFSAQACRPQTARLEWPSGSSIGISPARVQRVRSWKALWCSKPGEQPLWSRECCRRVGRTEAGRYRYQHAAPGVVAAI